MNIYHLDSTSPVIFYVKKETVVIAKQFAVVVLLQDIILVYANPDIMVQDLKTLVSVSILFTITH